MLVVSSWGRKTEKIAIGGLEKIKNARKSTVWCKQEKIRSGGALGKTQEAEKTKCKGAQ